MLVKSLKYDGLLNFWFFVSTESYPQVIHLLVLNLTPIGQDIKVRTLVGRVAR